MANKKGNKQSAEDIAALKGIAIAAAESVYHYKLIARSVNRDEDTLKLWRDDDPAFSDALEQGRNRFLQKKIKIARPEFLLERLEPEIFKQTQETNINIHMPQPILGSQSRKVIDVSSDDSDSQAVIPEQTH